jgi:hypothetical protein
VADLAVVHLVWGPLGPERLRRFLDSYRKHPAGAEHDLVVLFNGVNDPSAFQDELGDVEHRTLSLERPGLDLEAYLQAARRIEHERVCFLNSYSEIQADGWLARLDGALGQEGVAIAGATGSWGSHLSMVLYQLGLPSAYAHVYSDRRATALGLSAVLGERGLADPLPAGWRHRLHTLISLPPIARAFGSFPARHVRTNAFALERRRFLAVGGRATRDKLDAYALEAGRRSMTAAVEAAGLAAVVCGADGRVYERDDWPHSATLWQADQENLLITDNQTRIYAQADAARRRLLSRYAWGADAAPSPPRATREGTVSAS